MSATSKSVAFLALAFVISWGAAIGGHFSGLENALDFKLGGATVLPGQTVILVAMMAGPAIAALTCAIAFDKGRRIDALGLKFKPNAWWLAAYAAPVLIAFASVALSIGFGGSTFEDPAVGTIAMVAQTAPEQVEQVRALAPILAPLIFFQALVVGALINAVTLTFTEELGWRGYLYGLWNGAGFWRTSLATGAIWGVWHAPAILLYGLNYPDNRVLGVGLFIGYCMLLAPIITFIRERGASVWAAGIFHGTFNAVAGLTFITLSNPTFPWNGVVGIGGFAALAIGVAIVALLRRNTSEPAAIPTAV